MRIVLAPQGTHGDVRPLAALGQRLRAAGHEIVAAASLNHRDWLLKQGLGFAEVGLDLETPSADSDKAMGNPLRALKTAFSLLGRLADSQFSTLPQVVAGADLLVGAGLDFAGRTLAESLRIPYLFAIYVPVALRSRYHPPATFPYRPLPTWMNRLLWWSSLLGTSWTLGRRINAQRKSLGLEPVRDFGDYWRRDVVLAADEALAPSPPDWESEVRTGFWDLDDESPLDNELEEFLGAGPPPVYVGFGSMPDASPLRTLQALEELCSKVRLVVCDQRARTALSGVLPNTHWIDRTPHQKLFPRVAAAVHHGGAGTTHAAATAGVPQIVVPHIADQYYWAFRVQALGLGPAPLQRRSLCARTLGDAIAAVRKGSSYQQVADQFGREVRARSVRALSDAECLVEKRLRQQK